MLPDSLNRLFDTAGKQHFPSDTEFNAELARLVHANLAQTNLIRTAQAHFARRHGLNLVDFTVLTEIVYATDQHTTITPGYISERVALSASTLTSIVERLVSRGLLVRERDMTDKRRIAVNYTADAAELITNFYGAVGKIYAAAFADRRKAAKALDMAEQLEDANRSLYESLRDRIL